MCLLSIQHKMINNIAEGHVSKCRSTTGIEGGRGEIDCAMEKPSTVPPSLLPSLPSHFQLTALFSRIIDGACEVQRTGMKMSQSLGSKTRAMAKGGAAGATTHAVFIAVFDMRKEGKKNGSDLQSAATQISLPFTVLAVLEEADSSFTLVNI